MKRKGIVFILLLILTISLCQCSKNNKNYFKDKDENTEESESVSISQAKGKFSSESRDKGQEEDKEDGDKDNKNDKHIPLNEKENDKKECQRENSKSKNIDKFYGKWDVKKIEAYSNDNKSNDNTNDILGKTIEFSKDKISYNGKDYDKPKLSTRKVTNSEFNKNYHKNLSDFMIKDDNAQELRVGDSGNIGIGDEYIWKNSDTLMMVKNGNIYELKKR